mmetsp:Transcript_27008/g.43497  ORF Transcript_27008/g.43497 Transcript_27008/m.43497 type:complete len:866 (-) Transcript_27008:1085-3682(-)
MDPIDLSTSDCEVDKSISLVTDISNCDGEEISRVQTTDEGQGMSRKRTSVRRTSPANERKLSKKIQDAIAYSSSDDGLDGSDEDLSVQTRMAFSTALDFSSLELKPDHVIRPIWVCPSRKMYLEAASRFYKPAYDFLVAVAEPISRPRFIHEYELSSYSLYAAVSIGLTPNNIIETLERLSKTQLPSEIVEFIRECADNFGKAKLVLKQNRMFVESAEKSTLERLLKEPVILAARSADGGFERSDAALEEQSNLDRLTNIVINVEAEDDVNVDETDLSFLLDDMDPLPAEDNEAEAAPTRQVYNFEIKPQCVEEVRRSALKIDYPLMEEYDFRNDNVNGTLRIELRPSTEIRPYQERSLSKMFGNGRARSGVIVLPCGAGKTLTGITACCTIKRSCIVLCTGGVAGDQWRKQLLAFTTISPKNICVFTSKEKNEIDPVAPCVLITTYSMMAARPTNRSAHTAEMLRNISNREWSLMILDEVHVTPAKLFRKVLTNVKAHCKLGLTATLVREDDLIEDLNFLIGPKLYEANWLDLTEAGYLASVCCKEVRCAMTAEFFAEYLHENSVHVKQLLYTMNPNKCIAADYLVRQHEARGDKVLVFCDNIMAVKYMAELLSRPYISGSTPYKERMVKYNQFRKSTVISTLILSKVGDVAIDLPEANVIIQVSSHFGSRRQEAQRLGRILRPKGDGRTTEKFDAYFYTLVSLGTDELYYASKRQQYLVDQGYNYKVVTDICDIATTLLRESTGMVQPVTKLLQPSEQLSMLQKILVLSKSNVGLGAFKQGSKKKKSTAAQKKKKVVFGEDDVEEEEEDEEEEEESSSSDESEDNEDVPDDEETRPKAKRRRTNIDIISGTGTLDYFEYNGDE